jgi:hypothetical protein
MGLRCCPSSQSVEFLFSVASQVIFTHKSGCWTQGVAPDVSGTRFNPHSPFPSPPQWQSVVSHAALRGRGAAHLLPNPGRRSRVTAVTRSLALGYHRWPLQGQKPLSLLHCSLPCVQPKRCGTRSALRQAGIPSDGGFATRLLSASISRGNQQSDPSNAEPGDIDGKEYSLSQPQQFRWAG